MRRSIGLWELLGFGVTSLGGTILHFLYEWLGEAKWIAPFSGVNESTWEHMKLLFWPMAIFAIFQRRIFKDRDDFWCVKMKGIVLGLFLIPVIFYTYNGVIGRSPDWINIAIFFISAAVAYLFETRTFNISQRCCKSKGLSLAVIVAIAILFVIFTFYPLKLSVFIDPTSQR